MAEVPLLTIKQPHIRGSKGYEYGRNIRISVCIPTLKCCGSALAIMKRCPHLHIANLQYVCGLNLLIKGESPKTRWIPCRIAQKLSSSPLHQWCIFFVSWFLLYKQKFLLQIPCLNNNYNFRLVFRDSLRARKLLQPANKVFNAAAY